MYLILCISCCLVRKTECDCVLHEYWFNMNCAYVSLHRRLTMQDLEEAAEEEVGKESTRTSFRRQDSDAARMYN